MWKVDLGTSYKISDFTVINYYNDSRYYKYKVYSSIDNVNWTQVAEKSDSSLSTIVGKTFTFTSPIIARYIRINISFNSINQGSHIVEFIAHGTPFNIALNKPSFASSEEPSSEKSKANDGSLDTFWGSTPYPQWWKVDLGTSYKISDFTVINYYNDSRYYKYKVYSSIDNVNWTQVAEKSDSSLSTIVGKTFTFTSPIIARYIRINISFNSINQGSHIVEFIANGEVNLSNKTSNNNIQFNNFVNKEKKNIFFKNPIKIGEKLQIYSSNSEKILSIEIFDLSGKNIFSEKFLNEKVFIETESFSKGLYLIKINDTIDKIIFE